MPCQPHRPVLSSNMKRSRSSLWNCARRHLALLLLLLACCVAPVASGGGRWDLLQRSIGVSAMHMQLLHNDRVIIFDRTDFGRSNLSLPDGRCRRNTRDTALKVDCTAHSAEYDVKSNTFRPLSVFTDTWCSSGTVAPDGTLVQTGGWNDGYRNVRTMPACGKDHENERQGECDWKETQNALAANRWYATNQILPDGRAFIVGGRRQFNYEFYPKAGPSDTTSSVIRMPFLVQTSDPEENNLYPFVHLNIDGNLFIFAKNRAILLDYKTNKIVRTYPVLAGGDPRNYPSSGSSVLLPLKPNPTEAEVLVCGGAPAGSYNSAKNGTFVPALATCGRIKITDPAPAWVIETMPSPRVMGDMILLPNGAEVAIVNGAAAGAAGWEQARSPAYAPVIYRPDHAPGDRFEVQSAAGVARMYHSSVVLLRDGRLLVGGSNPHVNYNFSAVPFPTELSLEAFSPVYLDASDDALRPRILDPSPTGTPTPVTYGKNVTLQFAVPAAAARRGRRRGGGLGVVSVTMVAPSFTTHSFAMNQRLLHLEVTATAPLPNRAGAYASSVTMPATAVLAPPGYYMVFVVNGAVPSEGIWVHIQ